MRARQWAWLIARRILFMIPILFGVATATFFLTRLAGGDPAYLIAGSFATEEVIASIQEQLEFLDGPAARGWGPAASAAGAFRPSASAL